MKNVGAVGIVCEFDPFHLGHARLLGAVRERWGADCAVVCCMSGNFIQRGTPALLSKHCRAELALLGGADLVLELPTPYAVSSAQRFARAGVGLLCATGVVDAIAFGSESGDEAALRAASGCLETEPYRVALRSGLDAGKPFAAAREAAIRACVGAAADCLRYPNDTLAVEYLSAVEALGAPMEVLAVRRTDGGHDGSGSASAIRALLRDGREEAALQQVPEACRPLLRDAPRSDWSLCERAVLARLRSMGEKEFLALPDCGEGLHRRLMAAAAEAATLAELLERAKTRRYPASRIRRAVLWAFLGLEQGQFPELPPYLKVLGFNGRGRDVLRQMKERAALPVLTRPSHARELADPAAALLETESRCTDLYGLTFPTPSPCGQEWREPPVVLA